MRPVCRGRDRAAEWRVFSLARFPRWPGPCSARSLRAAHGGRIAAGRRRPKQFHSRAAHPQTNVPRQAARSMPSPEQRAGAGGSRPNGQRLFHGAASRSIRRHAGRADFQGGAASFVFHVAARACPHFGRGPMLPGACRTGAGAGRRDSCCFRSARWRPRGQPPGQAHQDMAPEQVAYPQDRKAVPVVGL